MPAKEVQSIVLGDAVGGRLVKAIGPDPMIKGNMLIEFMDSKEKPISVNPNASLPVEQLTLTEAIRTGLVKTPDWWKPW